MAVCRSTAAIRSMQHIEQADVIAFLADPASHGGVPVRRINTHISHIFLAGDVAWKLKRAVKMSFLDFSTLEKRKAACDAELALNRRTAPALYKCVVPVIRRADGTLALGCRADPGGEDAEVVEYLVHMARFADGALLSEQAEQGRLTATAIRDLGDTLAEFHGICEVQRDAPAGAVEMSRLVDDITGALAALPVTVLDSTNVSRWVSRAPGELHRLRGHLEARRRGGFVRHCHGDMHLANIAMVNGRALPFDAIEFSAEVATIDVLYDLAFPVMDLLRFGEHGMANLLMNRYLAATRDYAGLRAFPFFLSVRAAVRAMVLGIEAAGLGDQNRDHNPARDHARDHTPDHTPDHTKARADAQRFLELANNLLCPAPARLVAVGGLSGVGKSTIARAMALGSFTGAGAVVISSDPARKYMFGKTPEVRLPPEAYESAVSEMLFDQFYSDIKIALEAGAGVVADATFARPRFRQNIEEVGQEAGVPFTGLWLAAPVPTLEGRLAARPKGASDADVRILALQLEKGTGPVDWVEVDATGNLADTVSRAQEALEAAQPKAP